MMAGLPLGLTGCGPLIMATMMIHPRTGERITCRPFPTYYDQGERINCVIMHQQIGFVDIMELTPEQRETITPRSSATTVKIER